ncbi:cellulose synthase/poly-beta-1,6-N-acetylglucosamine synthase-like glycosyltransferase/peptidoglycan/xylan/chitin deacetylase (PgdA/CDA1 family) [Actinoplanes lutulentus]|uniref:Cellulose synthase/poly-beta-1,6-N-acetylglucosamine synthase-like glycosyltransferase n=1 Tax=Actinoplanes lutulentus TaxID=1287878 RepID=A0A327ZME4_9ACTN|nr:bifunctional polysaccharide deacetylase/glycosyltransferase family 2 protein [Actinoplanes lutulentus]MBB2941894.1 cellulose synthase/poly-beta-1,6-N-acetylglucosamine synthase-like glycosyltransferase/peptidoglycan/xylan/chitin deacetylase (PgdA/CDA1 family) [Actinoplanes lutulentus]RAK39811.1 cellulose synthase/poly-beta-1,6-N-acetylglucosamine synthase-like glycosyltransferase [Actinoplanes lutulentus]
MSVYTSGKARPPKDSPPILRRIRVPEPRWVVFAVLLTLFASILLVNGLVEGEFTQDGAIESTAETDQVPAEALNGGPIIQTDGSTTTTVDAGTKQIVLTFDDGPDPEYTPEILDVLAKYDVPATFFMIGSEISKHPSLVRQVVDAGHEIGIHTFTHPEMSGKNDWRRSVEMQETQYALAGAAGVTSVIFRPPYSSTVAALDNTNWAVIQEMGQSGYLTVVNDLDSRDWEADVTMDDIVEAVTPDDGAGAVLLFHDGGGDRSDTAEALATVIPALQAQGYTFTTVAALSGMATVNPKATAQELVVGTGLVGAVQIARNTTIWFSWLLLAFGVLTVARLALMLALGRRHANRHKQGRRRVKGVAPHTWGRPYTDPVTVIVPAYNEKECIADTVRSLAASTHPIRIIVVDDGSTDGTAEIAEGLGYPNVTVIWQPNSGKPAALNTGIAAADTEVVVMMDGDTVFEPDTVRNLVQAFSDPEIGAVAGNAKVANRKGLIALWQHIEYVVGFSIDRRAYDVMRCMATVPGAIGAFRLSALRQVNGLSDDTLAEDTDLTIAMIRAGWRVVYEEHARAWTEAPTTISQLWRQRYRWSYGTMQAMWKHRRALVEKGAGGKFGRRGLLNLLMFQTLMPLLSPLIDVFLIYGFLFLDPLQTAIAWLTMLAIQMISTVYAFRLDGEKLKPVLMVPLQQFVYRQLMYLVLIQSVLAAVGGIRLGWQKLHRAGGLSALLGARTPAN